MTSFFDCFPQLIHHLLGQLSEYCQPEILHYHQTVLPIIFQALEVRTHVRADISLPILRREVSILDDY